MNFSQSSPDWVACPSYTQSCSTFEAFQVAQWVKNTPANAGDTGDSSSIPGLGRPPGGGYDNPPRIVAWRIPWIEEPGRLQSMGTQEPNMTEATEHMHN